jgi:hypothetical protein
MKLCYPNNAIYVLARWATISCWRTVLQALQLELVFRANKAKHYVKGLKSELSEHLTGNTKTRTIRYQTQWTPDTHQDPKNTEMKTERIYAGYVVKFTIRASWVSKSFHLKRYPLTW